MLIIFSVKTALSSFYLTLLNHVLNQKIVHSCNLMCSKNYAPEYISFSEQLLYSFMNNLFQLCNNTNTNRKHEKDESYMLAVPQCNYNIPSMFVFMLLTTSLHQLPNGEMKQFDISVYHPHLPIFGRKTKHVTYKSKAAN